ncbi:fumarylacetoacetate hydrolase family protein [Paracoccus sp. p4-l81]|uniref:fumarylacetoacetate hydrolase family protein n=1 Tax=Paracoccus sp. p4-l81 TaxID=3342806 RepID=UPI0035BAC076
MTYAFDPAPPVALPITGSDALFPVRRIFCIGSNYADHAAEMGNAPRRDMPTIFTKSAPAIALSGSTIPFPSGTDDLHHEVELVAALGPSGVFGYAVGLDLTRRDLQARAKDTRGPWDLGKDFDNSAILGPLTLAETWGLPGDQAIRLSVNGAPRQDGRLSQMIWPLPALIATLGSLYRLQPGDLVFTGTPAGVGPLRPDDEVQAEIDGLAPLSLRIQPSE